MTKRTTVNDIAKSLENIISADTIRRVKELLYGQPTVDTVAAAHK